MVEHYKNLSLENIIEIVDGELIIEEWTDISEYEGLYAISNFGRVKSYPKSRKNKVGICTKRMRILQQADRGGYLLVGLSKYGHLKTFSVHILVANAYVNGKNIGLEVNHKKGNRKDNRAWQLEWITHQQNIQHAFDIGIKHQRGSKNPSAILNETKVLEIRSKFKPLNYTRKMLADEYGVSVAAIKQILNKKNWSHI